MTWQLIVECKKIGAGTEAKTKLEYLRRNTKNFQLKTRLYYLITIVKENVRFKILDSLAKHLTLVIQV